MSRSMHQEPGDGCRRAAWDLNHLACADRWDPVPKTHSTASRTVGTFGPMGAAIDELFTRASRTFDPEHPRRPYSADAGRPMLARLKEGWVERKLNDLDEAIATLRGSMARRNNRPFSLRRWRHCEHQGNCAQSFPCVCDAERREDVGRAGIAGNRSLAETLSYNKPDTKSLTWKISGIATRFSALLACGNPSQGDLYTIDDQQLTGRLIRHPARGEVFSFFWWLRTRSFA